MFSHKSLSQISHPNASIYPSLFTIAVNTVGQQYNFLPNVKQGNFVGDAGSHLETNCLKEEVPSEKGL